MKNTEKKTGMNLKEQYTAETGIKIDCIEDYYGYTEWLEAKLTAPQPQEVKPEGTLLFTEEWQLVKYVLSEEIKDMRKDRGLLKLTENELDFLSKLEALREKLRR